MADLGETASRLASRKLPVFPLGYDKRPLNTHGFLDATTDPEQARRDCARATYLGVPTGAVSCFDALDLDYIKHPEILPTVERWRQRLMEAQIRTRMHRTRSGGEHWLFLHRTGQGNTAGVIPRGMRKRAPGIDRRGDGGYIVWWPASGFELVSNARAIEWPSWLLDELDYEPPFVVAERKPKKEVDPNNLSGVEKARLAAEKRAEEALIQACIDLGAARNGTRNALLNDKTFYLAVQYVKYGLLDEGELSDAMADAARQSGLPAIEVEKTIASALRAGRIKTSIRLPPI